MTCSCKQRTDSMAVDEPLPFCRPCDYDKRLPRCNPCDLRSIWRSIFVLYCWKHLLISSAQLNHRWFLFLLDNTVKSDMKFSLRFKPDQTKCPLRWKVDQSNCKSGRTMPVGGPLFWALKKMAKTQKVLIKHSLTVHFSSCLTNKVKSDMKFSSKVQTWPDKMSAQMRSWPVKS